MRSKESVKLENVSNQFYRAIPLTLKIEPLANAKIGLRFHVQNRNEDIFVAAPSDSRVIDKN
jgi:hypothetical protein